MLLIHLFKYLQNTATVGRQHIKSAYNSLWSDVYRALKNNVDCSTVLSKLAKERSLLGTPKLIHYQDSVIKYLLTPNIEWNDNKLHAFTMAMDDCGLLPGVLSDEQQNIVPNLTNDVVWKRLKRREQTFACERGDEMLCDSDDSTYEAVLRYAYSLDFTLLKKTLSDWTPSYDWIPVKASMSYLFDRQAAVGALDKYVESNENIIGKYKASILCNAISGEYPERYQLGEYWTMGLDGINDVAKYIAQQSQLKDNKLFIYGQTERTVCLNPSNRAFTESLRLLQYFAKEGFMPTMQITTLLSAWDWYHCFINIFDIFPYPSLFYTLCYHDEKLARKIGQEYAYSEDLKDELPRIQQALLRALGNPDTPQTFKQSLLLISKEIYCALDEGCWFDLFEANVLLPYLRNMTSSSDVYDDVYKHVCSAIDNIYSPENVLRVLKHLVDMLPINTVVPSSLISGYLNIRVLPKKGLCGALTTLKDLDFKSVYVACYSLNHYGKLPKSIASAIRKKISRRDIDAVKKNPCALLQISSLFSDIEFIQLVKSAVLESNVWDCGIRDGMRVRPNVIQLEYFPKWYVWGNEERGILFENMIDNLSLMENQKRPSEESMILLGNLVEVVYSMLFLLKKNNIL